MCLIFPKFFVVCFAGFLFLKFFPNSGPPLPSPHGYDLTPVGALTFAHVHAMVFMLCYGSSAMVLCFAMLCHVGFAMSQCASCRIKHKTHFVEVALVGFVICM